MVVVEHKAYSKFIFDAVTHNNTHSDCLNSLLAVLLGLLEANPSNTLARNYLLCFDLMRYDMEAFMEDYVPDMIKGRLYHEAVLIWLNQHEMMSEQAIARYGVDASTVDRLGRFYTNPNAFKNSYWLYFLKAMQQAQ